MRSNNQKPMLKHRDFFHQNIKYSFNWNLTNHKVKLSQLQSNREEFKKLGTFLKRVYQGSIPNDLFNRRGTPRVSQFKIKGLKNAFLSSFSKQLIRSGTIMKSDSSAKLPKYVEEVFSNFQKEKKPKPNHGPILKRILIKDKDSIAMEVPIWRIYNNVSITGHIDLIQIEDNMIKVIDYKPDENFLYSIPQVATYGFLIKKVLDINNLKCISFNKGESWEYDPEILMTDIKEYLISHRISRKWENFL